MASEKTWAILKSKESWLDDFGVQVANQILVGDVPFRPKIKGKLMDLIFATTQVIN